MSAHVHLLIASRVWWRKLGPTKVQLALDAKAPRSTTEFLLAAEIMLSCLNRCVSKQELNLLRFPSGQVA